MTVRIAVDVIADMPFHHLVVVARHAFAALTASFAVFEETVGRVLHREFRSVAPEGSGAHFALGGYPKSVGLLAALELAALAMAVGVHDVDDPARALRAAAPAECFTASGYIVG